MPWRLEDDALDLDDRPTADNCRYNEFPQLAEQEISHGQLQGTNL